MGEKPVGAASLSVMSAASTTPPGWPHCGQGADPVSDPVGCRGVHVSGYSKCLAHLNEPDRGAYLAGLTSGADVDHRGTTLTAPLLQALLQALQDPTSGRPTFGVTRFDEALFTGAVFLMEARFAKAAIFRKAIFADSAFFLGSSFTGDAIFSEAKFNGSCGFAKAEFDAAHISAMASSKKLRSFSKLNSAELPGSRRQNSLTAQDSARHFSPMT